MQWINLVNEEGLTHLVKQSFNRPQLIFKYSETCSLSEMMKIRMERAEVPGNMDFHFLDIWKYRSLSNKIAADFHVHHESP